jgi:hypothetical protein
MKETIATTVLLLCMAGIAAATQRHERESQANQRAAQQPTKADHAEAGRSAAASAGCTPTNAGIEASTTEKSRGDPSASQNVVEYGGGGI